MKNSYFKVLLLLVLCWIGTSTTFSQIVGTSAYMYGDNVEIGINDAGHEGAPRVVASNNRSNQPLASPVYFGFVANPQLDGWTDYDGDFFTPGSPENGFGLEIDGINYSNNASGSLEQIPGSITSYNTIGDCIFVEWDGTIADVDVHIVYRLITTELYYTTEVTLTNNGAADLTDVYYYRNLDPDNNVTIGGGYGTQNTVVAQPTPACEKALVTATQTAPWDSYIGIGAIGEDFRVSYGGFANRDASNIWNGVAGLTGGVGASLFADQAISLAYRAEDLPVGEPETFLFTVVLDAAQIDAAIASLYYFDYDGGAGIVDECAPVVDTAKICAGASVILTVDGPSADAYDWVWAPPAGLSVTLGPTTEASPLATTEYTVVGTPAAACLSATIEKTIVVEVGPAPIIEIVDPGSQCEDFDLTTLTVNNLEGSAVDISYYSVIPDSINQVVGLWPSDFIAEGDVVYLLMANPITGCYDVEPVIIDFSGGAVAGTDNTDVLCNDAGSLLDLNTLLTGADAGGEWTEVSAVGSGGFDGLSGTLTATGVDSGTYYFEYVALGVGICENDTALMTITINREALAGLDGAFDLCNTAGISKDLNDLLDGNNGIGTWVETTASGQFTAATGVFDASGLLPGDYTFTYTVDALAPCVPDMADFTITILPNPAIEAGDDLEVCIGETVTLAAAGAGVGGTYDWAGPITDGVAFAPLVTDTYSVVGTDMYGCASDDDVTVTVNPLPEVVAGEDEGICAGEEVVLVADGAGIGAIYDWTGGIIDGLPFAPMVTDTYSVIGTDENGCVNTDEVEVIVNAIPPVVAGDDVAICTGDWVTLEGDGCGIGGVYAWTGGGVDGVPFSPGETAVYTVTGTDIYGCVNTDEVTVIVNPLPIIDGGEDYEICAGGWAIFYAEGAGVDGTYDWTGDVIDAEMFGPEVTDVYTVTGTDINGCTNTDDVLVTVNPLPEVNAGPDEAICIGEETILTASGAGALGTYVWDAGIIDGEAFEPAVTALYTVVGTDENGCITSDSITVEVVPLPTIDAGEDMEVCIGEALALYGAGAGVGGVYTWDADVYDGVLFNPESTGSYTVTGTTIEGCANTDEITIIVNPLPLVAFMGDEIMGCPPLKVNFTGLTEGDSYDWDFGDGTGVTSSDPAHLYTNTGLYDVTLTITSEDGCVATVVYENYIDIAPTPKADFTYSPYEIDVRNPLVSFDNHSVDADFYEWEFGDLTAGSVEEEPEHEFPAVGDVSYIVRLKATNTQGCVDNTEEIIPIKDVLLYYIPNAFTPDGDTYNENFGPVFVSGLDIYDYHLMIFNRWGELVFESFDADYGWNGMYGDGGMVDDGTYIWKIEFGETMSDKKHFIEGHVTVLK